jgi:hypothetical protein
MIKFDPASHTYTVDGVRYPSVTQIISDMGLYGDTSYFTEYCRERGLFVHKIIQYHLSGELDEATIDPALRGYFEAWLKFQREASYVSDACEKVMASDSYRFAGTVDHVGHLNGHPCLIDTKTGAMSPATALQLAGYEVLVKQPGIKRFGLQLTAEGNYKLREFNDRQDRNIFLAALACHFWKSNNRIGRAA